MNTKGHLKQAIKPNITTIKTNPIMCHLTQHTEGNTSSFVASLQKAHNLKLIIRNTQHTQTEPSSTK